MGFSANFGGYSGSPGTAIGGMPNLSGLGGGGSASTGNQTGAGAYGAVPGPIAVPPSTFSQLNTNIPGFSGLTGVATGVIGSEQSGQLSPNTLKALTTAAAQRGVASGMPGSGLSTNALFGNIAGFSENLQRQGVQDYLSLVSGLGPTQTNPNLAADISARNSNLAAAPNPAAAAAEQERLWQQHFMQTQAAGQPQYRGPGGGTIVSGPRPLGTDSLGFPTDPSLAPVGYPNISAVGPANADPSTDPFAAWNKIASTWTSNSIPGQGDYYAGDSDYIPDDAMGAYANLDNADQGPMD